MVAATGRECFSVCIWIWTKEKKRNEIVEGVQGKPGIEERSHGNEYGTNMAACFTYAFLLCCNLTTYALLIERREWRKGHLAGISEAGY